MKPHSQPRAVWSGSLVLGEVNVAVSLFVAQQRQEPQLKTLHRECGSPLKEKRWCPVHDREIPTDERAKGYEIAPGRFAQIEDGELSAPTSKEIQLDDFVNPADVPVLHLDRTYYVAPAPDEVSRTSYAVLERALTRTQLAGLARLTMYGKENACLVRAFDEKIILTTLYLAEDIRAADRVDSAAPGAQVKLAAAVILSRRSAFAPSKIRSPQRSRIAALLKAKRADNPAPETGLTEALRGSIRKPRAKKPASTR